MNPLLKSAIRELQDGRGVRLDPLTDLDHIFRLKALADAVLGIQRDLRTDAILHPAVRVGSAVFRRLSIGSIEFLNKRVALWWPSESDIVALSWAFCHANSDRPDLIWGFTGDHAKDDWKRTVEAWARTIGVSWPVLIKALQSFQAEVAELDAILQDILGPAKVNPNAEKPKSESFGPLIDLLSSQYSFTVPPEMTPAEYWIWRVPQEEIEAMVDACLNRIEADEKKKRKPGTFATDPDKLFIRAHFAFRKYLDQIVEEKKGLPHVE
jgi:hypothetical protein